MLNDERGESMAMIPVKTDSLKGAALDWAVAKVDVGCNGLKWVFDSSLGTFVGVADIYGNKNKICAFLAYSDARYDFRKFMLLQRDGATYYRPSADWSQGGPLIDLYQVSVVGIENTIFHATAFYDGKTFCLCAKGEGPTRLVAAMRAIVSLKLGDTVEVPAELVGDEP